MPTVHRIGNGSLCRHFGQNNRIARSTLDKIKFIIKHDDTALLARVRFGWTCVSDAWDECSKASMLVPML